MAEASTAPPVLGLQCFGNVEVAEAPRLLTSNRTKEPFAYAYKLIGKGETFEATARMDNKDAISKLVQGVVVGVRLHLEMYQGKLKLVVIDVRPPFAAAAK